MLDATSSDFHRVLFSLGCAHESPRENPSSYSDEDFSDTQKKEAQRHDNIKKTIKNPGFLGFGSSGPTRTVPCRAVPCRAVPCRAVPCRAVPCRAVPCRAVPCRAVPCRAVPCHAVPCRPMPCMPYRACLKPTPGATNTWWQVHVLIGSYLIQ
jgi:hypothetical protein